MERPGDGEGRRVPHERVVSSQGGKLPFAQLCKPVLHSGNLLQQGKAEQVVVLQPLEGCCWVDTVNVLGCALVALNFCEGFNVQVAQAGKLFLLHARPGGEVLQVLPELVTVLRGEQVVRFS